MEHEYLIESWIVYEECAPIILKIIDNKLLSSFDSTSMSETSKINTGVGHPTMQRSVK